MTTINPGDPAVIGNWRTAEDRSENPAGLRDRITPGGAAPPEEGGGQPQILGVENLNGNARVTVGCPAVPGADRFEWWAGSNEDHWSSGSQAVPNVSFTSQVVFQAPRQQEVNDNSFFCYRGANSFGSAPNYNCNGYVIEGVEADPDALGAPNIDSASSTSDGESVVLTVSAGANAENHDVHRVFGDTNFTASDLNRIATNIGPIPASYGDSSASPDNVYSYRLTSKASGFAPVPSNRVAISTAGDLQPNEPAGFTTWTSIGWIASPYTDPNLGWQAFGGQDNADNFQAGFTDSPADIAPRSPPSVVRVRVPESLESNEAPINVLVPRGPSHREIYVAFWMYFPADYIINSDNDKFFWPRINNGPNSPFTAFRQGSEGRIVMAQQAPALVPWRESNTGAPPSHYWLSNMRDVWFRTEWYFKMNTINQLPGDSNRADGIVRCWVTRYDTGVTHQILDYADVRYMGIDAQGYFNPNNGDRSTGVWNALQWNPTYGGTNPTPHPDQFYYCDHAYVSSGSTV